jgi:hypothetical protein
MFIMIITAIGRSIEYVNEKSPLYVSRRFRPAPLGPRDISVVRSLQWLGCFPGTLRAGSDCPRENDPPRLLR